MPTPLGAHNARVDFARSLLDKKGRREHAAFSFEGPTLLAEALASGVELQALYATRTAYETTAAAAEAESRGVDVYLVDERTMAKISDVETPTGLLAVAPVRLESAAEILEAPGLVLGLADLNDPGNAGTLLRSAEAFGARGVIFGSRGAEPHHPKVVRAAMGAVFRLRMAVAAPADLHAVAGDWQITGLAASGERIDRLSWHGKHLVLVGNERRGMGPWEPLCTRLGAIPMSGEAESLNAAVAGSIALYEAAKHLHL